ncbi:MAG: ABC-2 transporter permease [Eubacteriaceae bacterium]|nr:ABC-2 transporter permease [Eubacteriaceae bacterium]
MKGLIIKDYYMVKKYLKFYIVMIITFSIAYACGADSAFFTIYPSVLSGVLVTTLLSYDESFRFLEYSATLPITKKTFVVAKYAFALIMVGVMLVINTISATMNFVISGNFSVTAVLMQVCLLVLITVLGFALTLPLTFRFGQEKGRIVYIMVIGLLSGVFMGIGYSDNFIPQNSWTACAMLLAASVLIFIISMILSIKFYEKREL